MGWALVLVLLVAASSATAPAGADAQAGGTAPPPVRDGQGAPGDMAVDAPRAAFVGDRVRIGGRARRARRRPVRIEQRRPGAPWTLVARVRADRKGAFAVSWRPRRAGRYEIRARVGRGASRTTGGTSVPVDVGAGGAGGSNQLSVYERARATWYGPGFFGRRTACGVELTETTLGVAHRRLPCGTRVELIYGGRVIVAPVIDRGPYANKADWDLTQATAQRLGMTGTSRIGAMLVSPDR